MAHTGVDVVGEAGSEVVLFVAAQRLDHGRPHVAVEELDDGCSGNGVARGARFLQEGGIELRQRHLSALERAHALSFGLTLFTRRMKPSGNPRASSKRRKASNGPAVSTPPKSHSTARRAGLGTGYLLPFL
jgi:hypothetical protein